MWQLQQPHHQAPEVAYLLPHLAVPLLHSCLKHMALDRMLGAWSAAQLLGHQSPSVTSSYPCSSYPTK
jgi:hypothetical protein